MNAWVLAKDLDRIASTSEDEDLQRLCQRIKDKYQYPVDTVLLSPKLEVLGHRNVNEATRAGPGSYGRLLRRALSEEVEAEAPRRGKGQFLNALDSNRRLQLTRKEPSGVLLDVLPAGQMIAPMNKLITIDLSDFETPGVLEIELRVGSSKGSGVFELLKTMQTDDSLALMTVGQRVSLGAGETGRIVHRFTSGEVMYFSAISESAAGTSSANAFHATLTVQPSASPR